MIRGAGRRLRVLALAALGVGAPVLAQSGGDRLPVPYDVGERLEYEVRFGRLKVGSGTMEVAGADLVRTYGDGNRAHRRQIGFGRSGRRV